MKDEECKTCKQNAKVQYKTIFQSKNFCSIECIKSYFNNSEKINYQTFKII
jgi:hypothetical protein